MNLTIWEKYILQMCERGGWKCTCEAHKKHGRFKLARRFTLYREKTVERCKRKMVFQDHVFRIDPSKVEDGKGKSPYDPRHNAASVLVGKPPNKRYIIIIKRALFQM